jgi:hypothetical protein
MYDMGKLKRINARISAELDALVQELASVQGRSVSEIVVSALKEFCSKHSSFPPIRVYESFENAGLIGCFKGTKHLSRNYKEELGDALDKKWPEKR